MSERGREGERMRLYWPWPLVHLMMDTLRYSILIVILKVFSIMQERMNLDYLQALPGVGIIDIADTEGADRYINALVEAGDPTRGVLAVHIATVSASPPEAPRPSGNGRNNRNRRNTRSSRRRYEERLIAHEKSVMSALCIIEYLANFASPQVFALIDKAEIESWFDHVNAQLETLHNNALWKQSGKLERHLIKLIATNINLLKHEMVLQVAFEKSFFKNLAQFIASREPPLLPCDEIANLVSFIVEFACNTYIMIHEKDVDPQNYVEKIWKKIDSSGLLVQFIRCATVPRIDGISQNTSDKGDEINWIVGTLLECMRFVKKKFKLGQPCGDTLQRILEGKDGYQPMDAKIRSLFQNLANLAQIVQNSGGKADRDIDRICRYCQKSDHSIDFQKSLMQCSRCKFAYYCSRECQVKDWKNHKKICVKSDDRLDEKSMDVLRSCLITYVKTNYTQIMAAIIDQMDATGLPKEELVLVADFTPDQNGEISALNAYPEITVEDVNAYLDGRIPIKPELFDPDDFLPNLKYHAKTMTDNALLCISLNADVVVVSKFKIGESFTMGAINEFRQCRAHGWFM